MHVQMQTTVGQVQDGLTRSSREQGAILAQPPRQLGIASNVVLYVLVLFYAWVFCLHVSAPCTCTAPGVQKRALDHFGTGIADYFELTHGCWAWKSGPLQEQSVLVTMDPLLISFRADGRHTGAQFTVILQTRVNNSRCLTAWRIAHSDQGLLWLLSAPQQPDQAPPACLSQCGAFCGNNWKGVRTSTCDTAGPAPLSRL